MDSSFAESELRFSTGVVPACRVSDESQLEGRDLFEALFVFRMSWSWSTSSKRKYSEVHFFTYATLGEKNRIENEIMKMYTLLYLSAVMGADYRD